MGDTGPPAFSVLQFPPLEPYSAGRKILTTAYLRAGIHPEPSEVTDINPLDRVFVRFTLSDKLHSTVDILRGRKGSPIMGVITTSVIGLILLTLFRRLRSIIVRATYLTNSPNRTITLESREYKRWGPRCRTPNNKPQLPTSL